MYFLLKIDKPTDSCRPKVSAYGCHTELNSSYLDHVIAPLVRDLPSYIRDTKRALQIFQHIHCSFTRKFIFNMHFDI